MLNLHIQRDYIDQNANRHYHWAYGIQIVQEKAEYNIKDGPIKWLVGERWDDVNVRTWYLHLKCKMSANVVRAAFAL